MYFEVYFVFSALSAHSAGGSGMKWKSQRTLLQARPDVYDIPVLDEIFLALEP